VGFAYASDTRGSAPFIPVWNAEPFTCPQLPTTLPTLDELIGTQGLTPDNVAARLLELSNDTPQTGHVYTLHAELEGGLWAPAFETLLEGWKKLGYRLSSMGELAGELTRAAAAARDRRRTILGPGSSQCKVASSWLAREIVELISQRIGKHYSHAITGRAREQSTIDGHQGG
jgi:hypothetical protein